MANAYIYSILATASIFTLLALSLNIITGYAGQAMMGIAAFFGIGAYTAAILTTHGIPFPAALLVAMIVSGAFGAVLGVISLRLQADFLAITTIGINFVMAAIFNTLKITGGTLGLTTRKPEFFGVRMNNFHFFIMTVIIIIIVCLLIVKMRRSWFGMALASIENDSGAARSFGINVSEYQILAFIIGTALAGLAGGIYAHRMGFISSTDFAFTVSIQVVSMCVIGGLGTIRGPIFGAILICSLPEILRFADNYRALVYALLLVIMVRFMPGGLLGDDSPIWKLFVKIWRKFVPRKKTRADLIAEQAASVGDVAGAQVVNTEVPESDQNPDAADHEQNPDAAEPYIDTAAAQANAQEAASEMALEVEEREKEGGLE